MQICANTVVTFDYILTDDANQVLDSSEGDEPLAYLHGVGNIIPGLEQALEGRAAGDRFAVTVTPAQAYGERDDALVMAVPRARFETQDDIAVGMRFHSADQHGRARVVTVIEVGPENVTVDANHPLAGMSLTFAVRVVEVRPATEEEIAHGHVHGPGGHSH
jgi:FKBP-type peptidyl-prolyl cis-trans isomerase SlyD